MVARGALALPSIRIITHVYAQRLPQYAVFLRAHLTSIAQFAPPEQVVRVSVCCSQHDALTVQVLRDFAPVMGDRLQVMYQSEGALFRRSIGRNAFAIAAHEDIVWFADVDHVVGPGCLQSIATQMEELEIPVLAWPKSLWIQAKHSFGDDFVKDNMNVRGPIDLQALGVASFTNQMPSPAFETKSYSLAIGGVQIVHGSFARKFGYLRDFPKWQEPRTDGKPFGDFRDDVKYRKFCLSRLNGVALDVVHLYRLRHTAVTYK